MNLWPHSSATAAQPRPGETWVPSAEVRGEWAPRRQVTPGRTGGVGGSPAAQASGSTRWQHSPPSGCRAFSCPSMGISLQLFTSPLVGVSDSPRACLLQSLSPPCPWVRAGAQTSSPEFRRMGQGQWKGRLGPGCRLPLSLLPPLSGACGTSGKNPGRGEGCGGASKGLSAPACAPGGRQDR